MKFDEALGMINALADLGQVPALASREHLSEAQRVVDAEFRRLRKIEAAAQALIRRANGEVRAGDLPRAVSRLREALEGAERTGPRRWQP